MNTRQVNSAAGVIMAALSQNRTATGIALSLESAGLLMSPEAAADMASVSTDAVGVAEQAVKELRREHELSAGVRQENVRLFLAWGSARMRARRKNEALEKLRARVAELEAERHSTNEALDDAVQALRAQQAAPSTVPAAYELATREHLATQLKQVIDRCAKRAGQTEQPLRRDLIARGMGLLSALHLVEAGSADNTEEDGEFAGYDEDADPPEGFPDEPIPYADPNGFSAETLLTRRGVRAVGGPSAQRSADKLTALFAPTQALRVEAKQPGACDSCGSLPERWCPDCAACEKGCFGGFDGNSCSHANAPWLKRVLREDPHDSPLHHSYRVPHDLPEMGGA